MLAWHNSGLNRGAVTKIAQTLLDQTVNRKMAIVMAAAGKIFVGEIMELAQQIRKEGEKEEEKITPEHLTKALARFYNQPRNRDLLPNTLRNRPCLFNPETAVEAAGQNEPRVG